MSNIGICKYCKHIDKDIMEKPCLHCAANLGAFEFDLSEHDKQIKAEVIEEILTLDRYSFGVTMLSAEEYIRVADIKLKEQDNDN